jgi:hypothetical protein
MPNVVLSPYLHPLIFALAASVVAGCSGSLNGLGPLVGDDGGEGGTTSDGGSDSTSTGGMEAGSNEGGDADPSARDWPGLDAAPDARADVAAEAASGCVDVVQPCYTGPAGTQGVGACHGGTQSCLGTPGVCNGEVLPAKYENCFNNIDDDCDGVVNNGCPTSLSLGADSLLGAEGGSGGTPTSAHCPVGAFISRVDSWFDEVDQHASGVSFYCATPTLVQGATSYSVTLAANAPAPYATVTGAAAAPAIDERADDCGLAGLTGITHATGLADAFVEGLGFRCGTSAVKLQADNTITFDFEVTGSGGYRALPGATGTFFDEACKSNEVMVGFNLREGSWLDDIEPICAALQANYIP